MKRVFSNYGSDDPLTGCNMLCWAQDGLHVPMGGKGLTYPFSNVYTLRAHSMWAVVVVVERSVA
jgi:hypothetical protein